MRCLWFVLSCLVVCVGVVWVGCDCCAYCINATSCWFVVVFFVLLCLCVGIVCVRCLMCVVVLCV